MMQLDADDTADAELLHTANTHTSLHTITNDEDDPLRGCGEDTDCQMGKITLAVSSSEFRLKIMQIRPFLTERAKHYAKTMQKDNSAGGAL